VKRYTFHLIPHTHWDREWYLPRAAFVARLVPALDDLIVRLEAEPCLRSFLLDGQTVLVEDYLRIRPEMAGTVGGLVRDGRLQVGPWYVLADELIPSGESLVRNLLAGAADASRLGRRCDVLYSPDAFGHPAAWPTLACQFGIAAGVVWRGLGGEAGLDGDLFRWFGPDGCSVLLYHLPPQGYEVGMDLPADPRRLPAAWQTLRDGLVARAASPHIAVFVGADHHAVHPDLCRLRDLIAELEPGSDVHISRLDEFFEAAADDAALVPALRGELRWSYGYTWTLQGVHGTRTELKRRHGETELLLERVAEPLAALATVINGTRPHPMLGEAWRTLLRSQFHDSISGCVSDAVATRVATRIDDASLTAREVARVSLDTLTGNDPDRARDEPSRTSPALVLWNGAPRKRGGVVIADVTGFGRDVLVGPPGSRKPRTGQGLRSVTLAGPGGPVAAQILGRATAQERLDSARHYPDQDEVEVVRVALRSPDLAGFELASLSLAGDASSKPKGRARAAGKRMENGLVEVSVDAAGGVTLVDRESGERFDDLLRIESGGDVGDTYTYAPPRADRIRVLEAPVRTRVLADGPLVAALEITGRMRLPTGAVAVRTVLSLHEGSRALRATIEVDNQARDHRLRVRMPTGLPGGPAAAGSAFGATVRDVGRVERGRYPRETPVATAPAHRFVARSVRRRGLAVFSTGFFEYELADDGDLIVTILRSVGELSRDDLFTRPGHTGWPTATPDAQSLGLNRMQVAVCPVTSEEVADGLALPSIWEDLFQPPRAVWLRQATPLRIPPIDWMLDGDGLVFSALKPAEQGDGVVFRCFNARGTYTSGSCRASFPLAAASRVRADEREAVPMPIETDGRTVRFSAEGHEIVTLLLHALPPANGED
jgi:alpha-mannosidase